MDDAVDDTDRGIYVVYLPGIPSVAVELGLYIQLYNFTKGLVFTIFTKSVIVKF